MAYRHIILLRHGDIELELAILPEALVRRDGQREFAQHIGIGEIGVAGGRQMLFHLLHLFDQQPIPHRYSFGIFAGLTAGAGRILFQFARQCYHAE